MKSPFQVGWLAPAGLILLSLVPALAGIYRLSLLATHPAVTVDNARFMSAPLPVVLHILSVIPYSLLGAFQFSNGIRWRWPGWHRASGRLLVFLGLIAALSGLWMTQFYIPPPEDGHVLYIIRLIAGSAMVLFILLGFAAIRRRNIISHRAWMTRAYALGLGAGTQVLTHLPWFIFVGKPDEQVRTILMGAGWAINLLVAEVIISIPFRADRSAGKSRV